MRIVTTECDHDTFDVEQAVADASGAELVVAQAFDDDTLVANCIDADAVLVQYAQLTADVMDRLPRLRAIGRYGVGVDSVDVAAATERGIAVCNVPDYGTEAVSDHAIAMALSVARGIPRLDRGVRAGSFDLVAVRPLYQTRERVFGVLGLGRIGTATARKAAGLGYEVIGYDSAVPAGATEHHGVRVVSLDELLRRSQVLSVHTPLTDETRGLVGAAEIATMRSDAIIVNTARGGIVDNDALVAALREGRLAGAGIDCHTTEPIPAEDELTTFDNVVLTPHLAWYSEESYEELKRRTIANVADVIAGRMPRDILNPEVLGAPGRNQAFVPGEGATR
ncbi:C-terminal binding protein [Sanguibacter sp. A247]|uniref:C-terminal binding protein n=1 Tax=unclassified Sanguibacter TaxID=2645534 RepID=UPI003FD738F1